MGSATTLSLVIPAYNEALRIGDTLRTLDAYLAARPQLATEFIVVDDGSQDDTSDVVRELARRLELPLRLMRYARNRGKGYAIRTGIGAASGDLVIFVDADLPAPCDELARLLEILDAGFDVAIGSRKLSGSEIVVAQPWHRIWIGHIFSFLVRYLITDVADAQCGLKAFRINAAREIFDRVRLNGFSFDAESLYVAQHLGHRVAEVPIRWEDKTGSRVSVLSDTLDMATGLVRIRVNAALGRYDHARALRPQVEVWSTDPAAAER